MATRSVEVVYRGIFQRTMARNIVRNIVFAAVKTARLARHLAVTATLRKEMASRPSNLPLLPTLPWNWKKAWPFTRLPTLM